MNYKKTIGILLPQSKAYPKMSKSFMNGLRLGLDDLEYDLIIEGIGNGSNTDELINKFQKINFQYNTFAITGIFGHVGFNELAELVSLSDQILVAADFGAKSFSKLPNRVFRNSLGLYDSLQTLLHFLDKRNISKIATSTCYYDAGYDFIHALDQYITNNTTNLELTGHFITPLHPRKNESDLMHSYFREIKPEAIISFHNGVFASEHAAFIEQNKLYNDFDIYSLPFSFTKEIRDNLKAHKKSINIIGNWFEEIESPENSNFKKVYNAKFNHTPDYFSLLGYENGMILKYALRNESNLETDELIKNIKITGPRGKISFDNIYRTSFYENYVMTVENNNTSINKIKNDTDLDYAKIFEENNFGWHNSYLCY